MTPVLARIALLCLQFIIRASGALPTDGRAICVDHSRLNIASAAAVTAHTNNVPVGLLLVVGWMHSHNGCAVGSAHSHWRQVSATQVSTEPTDLAVRLRRGFEVCNSWPGAVSFVQSGGCTPSTQAQTARLARTIGIWHSVQFGLEFEWRRTHPVVPNETDSCTCDTNARLLLNRE